MHSAVLHVLELTTGSGGGQKLAEAADGATPATGMVNSALIPPKMISISSVSELLNLHDVESY